MDLYPIDRFFKIRVLSNHVIIMGPRNTFLNFRVFIFWVKIRIIFIGS